MINSYKYMKAAVTAKDIRTQFHVSLANCSAAYVTLYTDPFASPCGTDVDDVIMASFAQGFLKECNFLIDPRNYIMKNANRENEGP